MLKKGHFEHRWSVSAGEDPDCFCPTETLRRGEHSVSVVAKHIKLRRPAGGGCFGVERALLENLVAAN